MDRSKITALNPDFSSPEICCSGLSLVLVSPWRVMFTVEQITYPGCHPCGTEQKSKLGRINENLQKDLVQACLLVSFLSILLPFY